MGENGATKGQKISHDLHVSLGVLDGTYESHVPCNTGSNYGGVPCPTYNFPHTYAA